MAAGHRVAAHSVLDRPEHGGTLPLDGDNTATNIMVGYLVNALRVGTFFALLPKRFFRIFAIWA